MEEEINIYIDRKKIVNYALIPLVASIILFIYASTVIGLLFSIIILLLPSLVLIILLILIAKTIIQNKPAISIDNKYIHISNQPITKILIEDIESIKLVTAGAEALHAKDPESIGSRKFYKILFFFIKNNEKYIEKAKWNWKRRLKRRAGMNIPLIYLPISFLNISPGELLKLCNKAIGKGYVINSEDIEVRVGRYIW